jgi:hypothetical protein
MKASKNIFSKFIKAFLLALAYLCFTPVFSQTQAPIPAENGKYNLYLGLGMRTLEGEYLSLSQIQQLFPQSQLLQGDLSIYGSDTYYDSQNTGTMVNLFFGIRLKESNTFEQGLRIGVTYGSAQSLSGNYNYEVRTPYDTLTSAQTGLPFYVDSVYSKSIYVSSIQDAVTMDLSYIIRVNAKGRVSFFTGVGLEAGAIINPRYTIQSSENVYYTAPNSGDYQARFFDGDFQNESFRTDGGFFGQVYLPIGIDFRIAKLNPFWSNMHVYTECRPAIQYSKFEGRDGITQTNFGVAFVGARFEF